MIEPRTETKYTYDLAGRRQTMTVTGQSAVNYTFDAADRITQITQGNSAVQFSYDGASRRATSTLPNGIVTSYSYDDASQLTGLTYSLGASVLGDLTYAYDQSGRRSRVTGSFARTGIPNPIGTTAYNANNQLTTWGTANLFYDANGNMTSDGTHSYTWDTRNHLRQIDSGSTATFSYDPFGRRVSKTILGSSTSFLYDGANLVQELSSGTPTANLLTGTLDEYFTRSDSSGPRHFLTDALGSTLSLTDSGGTFQTSYSFDAFGNTSAAGAGTANSAAFTGRELDSTGLYFDRSRYYSPVLGRFISEDPMQFGAGVNFYRYVGNDPVNASDPFGLDRTVVNLGKGWTGGVDTFNTGGQAGFEIHVYNPSGGEVGVVSGTNGWIGKHGFPDNTRPAGIPDEVMNAINGANVNRLRAQGDLPPGSAVRGALDGPGGGYLNLNRMLGIMPYLAMLTSEIRAASDQQIVLAGRGKNLSPPAKKKILCDAARIPGEPGFIMSTIGPMPESLAGCSPSQLLLDQQSYI